ncbi:MAG: geranylgeranyl reductase family protein [Spirochaetes bacterium]|nr:geranylgeranyl reductase family protein [Spirochaetota bacterium]
MKSNHYTVAIVGAGPAGAVCSHELANAGCDVVLFDHRAPWEKPCGGMLGPNIMKEFQFLQDYSYPMVKIEEITFISPKNDNIEKKLNNSMYTVSRKELGEFLLKRAITSGCNFKKEKVGHLEYIKNRWRIFTETDKYDTDIIIGADGANSYVRRVLSDRKNIYKYVILYGYFCKRNIESRCIFKFDDFFGYMWVFPRPHDTCIGIIDFNSNVKDKKEMYGKLDKYISSSYSAMDINGRWASLLPIITDSTDIELFNRGKNWYLIGDAAGYVDPLSGEGIYYSMKSAESIAAVIINQDSIINQPPEDFQVLKLLEERIKQFSIFTELSYQLGIQMTAALYYSSFLNSMK